MVTLRRENIEPLTLYALMYEMTCPYTQSAYPDLRIPIEHHESYRLSVVDELKTRLAAENRRLFGVDEVDFARIEDIFSQFGLPFRTDIGNLRLRLEGTSRMEGYSFPYSTWRVVVSPRKIEEPFTGAVRADFSRLSEMITQSGIGIVPLTPEQAQLFIFPAPTV